MTMASLLYFPRTRLWAAVLTGVLALLCAPSALGQDATGTQTTPAEPAQTETTPTETTPTETTPTETAPEQSPAALQYVESVPTSGGSKAAKPGRERQSAVSQLSPAGASPAEMREGSARRSESKDGKGKKKRSRRSGSPESTGAAHAPQVPAIPAGATGASDDHGFSLAWLAAALAVMTLGAVAATYGSRRARA
jgi:hypothetical protein